MKRNITTKFALVAGISMLTSGLSLTAATADPGDPTLLVEQAAPQVLTNFDASSNVVLPTQSDGEVVVSLANKSSLSITLPDAEMEGLHSPDSFEPGIAQTGRNGVVFYENSDGGTTVPIPQRGGGIAIHTIIENQASPTEFHYELALPIGAQARQVDGGGILLTDSEGSYLGAIANPWAKDAAGESVPTRFKLDGATLTQVVDHNLGEFQYPIVADPYFGIALHGATRWLGSGSSRKASLDTTPQMAVAWAAGAAYSYGWSEALSKMGSELNKETYRQQYKCHADNAPLVLAGGAFGFGNTWDLEVSRGTNANFGNVWAHRCNW